MKLLDKMKFGKNKNPSVVKVKRVVLTKRDVQENCIRIKEMMNRTPVGTDAYEKLQKELQTQIDILKRTKDANQIISVKDALVIGGGSAALIFFVALAREYPSAVKMAATILQWVPFRG